MKKGFRWAETSVLPENVHNGGAHCLRHLDQQQKHAQNQRASLMVNNRGWGRGAEWRLVHWGRRRKRVKWVEAGTWARSAARSLQLLHYRSAAKCEQGRGPAWRKKKWNTRQHKHDTKCVCVCVGSIQDVKPGLSSSSSTSPTSCSVWRLRSLASLGEKERWRGRWRGGRQRDFLTQCRFLDWINSRASVKMSSVVLRCSTFPAVTPTTQ